MKLECLLPVWRGAGNEVGAVPPGVVSCALGTCCRCSDGHAATWPTATATPLPVAPTSPCPWASGSWALANWQGFHVYNQPLGIKLLSNGLEQMTVIILTVATVTTYLINHTDETCLTKHLPISLCWNTCSECSSHHCGFTQQPFTATCDALSFSIWG